MPSRPTRPSPRAASATALATVLIAALAACGSSAKGTSGPGTSGSAAAQSQKTLRVGDQKSVATQALLQASGQASLTRFSGPSSPPARRCWKR
jgi:hypothetical protein